ncbi:DNA polymerase III subunit epsilon [Siculibacillus lacustris]|uniref:DNA polymerase III subunit epsilon n=1 Tax=Siculibacillus lacustris TaxID=1549641 RepID=A0A4Q9VM77_9HYPH|nr:DNA polymerase III subunit epsilon [Siculibacillus lacustris]TBW35795.1 DNA polymerase III subunit epsilon [Siculibacillus lacustris]
MREIVFDTETTGLDPRQGDRVVEIGCVELVNHIVTGQTFHVYLNPERTMPRGAFDVHGLSDAFLADKPKFAEIVDDFVAFIDGARLVAHNADFDIRFLNAELARVGRPPIGSDRVVDTLALARRRHPAGPNSLDALCNRYGIDNTRRDFHGALLDSELLAEVYVELIGGRQAALTLVTDASPRETDASGGFVETAGHPRRRPSPLPSRLHPEELAAHRAFLAELGERALWHQWAED